jgi:hypothetical protein
MGFAGGRRVAARIGIIARAVLALLAVAAACRAPPAAADPTLHAVIDRFARTYVLNADLTYTETVAIDVTLLTPRGIQERERSTFSYYPASQALRVLEAWVTQPDGTRIPVPDSSRFTRPSAAAQNAPGFTGSMTTTLLYPQLRVGSRTHVRWQVTQKVAPVNGFNVWAEPPLEMPVRLGEVTIDAPAGLTLHWAARGGFKVLESTSAGRRIITATIRDTHAEESERDMVSTADFQPLFLATSLNRLEDIGTQYYEQSHRKVVVTPDISALAARLAGSREGEDAARVIYAWVAANIRYVAVYMDPNDGWVPHAADAVLKAGYGDCKDHVVLMQALLAARGIEADAAMIDWGSRTLPAPLWVPQFNHAILYLPQYDRYLNPTNPYARYGTLDPRLAGKLAVIATPEGGRIGHTPPTDPARNVETMTSTIRLDDDGTLEGAATIKVLPTEESWMRSEVAAADSPEELADRLLEDSPEGGFGTVSSSSPHDLTRPLSVLATWRSPRAVAFQGTQAFVPVPEGPDPEPVSRLRQYLSPDGKRRFALLASAGTFIWTTHITISPTETVAALPSDVSMHNSAGGYDASYRQDGQEISVTRHLVLLHDVYEASAYPAFEALIYAPLQDARAVIVLNRPETMAATR